MSNTNLTVDTFSNIEESIKKFKKIAEQFNKIKLKNLVLAIKIKDKASKDLNKIKNKIAKLNKQPVRINFKVNDKATNKISAISKKLSKLKKADININVKKNEKDDGDNPLKSVGKSYISTLKNAGGNAVKISKACLEANKLQQGSEFKLISSLKLKNAATKGQINSILKLTATQQKNGVVSDEIQMSGAGQLAGYVNNAKAIETLLPSMNNLLVSQKGLDGTSEDAIEVATWMGQALNGETDSLSNAGIKFSEAQKKVLQFGTEQEKVALLSKVLQKNIGNANEELGATDIGAMQRAGNLFNDIKEKLGAALLPALVKVAEWFSENHEKIGTIVELIGEKIGNAVEVVIESFKSITEFISKHKTLVKGILIFIGVFATLISIVLGVASVISALVTIVGLFNITLGACPILWIIAVIALIAAAVAGLIIYWDQIKAVTESLWEKVTGFFSAMKQSVIDTVSSIVSKITEIWDAIQKFVNNPIGTVAEVVTKYVSSGKAEKRESKKESLKNHKPGKTGGKALGTSYWKGGLTYINERGGEIVDLPNGARVIPADKSENLLNGKNVTFGNIYITAKGITTNEVINELVPQLKLRLLNI